MTSHASAFSGRMYARADRLHYSLLRYDGACRSDSIIMRLLLCKIKVCTEPFCVQDRVCPMRSLSWSSSRSHPSLLSSAQVISFISCKLEASACCLKIACNSRVCSCEQAHAITCKLKLTRCPGPAPRPQCVAATVMLRPADMLFTPPEMVDQSAPYCSRVSPVRCALADKMPSLASFCRV